jgi:hypothetical protein
MRRARGTGALTPIIMMSVITSLRSLVKGSRSSALVNMSARLSAVGTLFTARVLSVSRSRTIFAPQKIRQDLSPAKKRYKVKNPL